MTNTGSPDLTEQRLRASLTQNPHDINLIIRYADYCLDADLWSMAKALCQRAELHAPSMQEVIALRARVNAAYPALPPLPPDPEIEASKRIWVHPALRWLRWTRFLGIGTFVLGVLALDYAESFLPASVVSVLWCAWTALMAYAFGAWVLLRRKLRVS